MAHVLRAYQAEHLHLPTLSCQASQEVCACMLYDYGTGWYEEGSKGERPRGLGHRPPAGIAWLQTHKVNDQPCI